MVTPQRFQHRQNVDLMENIGLHALPRCGWAPTV